jgi:hypothetical protein
VQVDHDEGVAVHIDPESYAVAREGSSPGTTIRIRGKHRRSRNTTLSGACGQARGGAGP